MDRSRTPCSLATLFAALVAMAGLGACAAQRPPEERTDDGLERVPSRSHGGVYRRPEADFERYRRVMIEPLTVEFTREWRKSHPEVTDEDAARIQQEAMKSFREILVEVLIDEGPYELSETREADVLHVVPRVLDLDITAPDVDTSRIRSYSPNPVKLQVNGELRDGVTGEVVLRVIMFDGQNRYPFNEMRLANRVTNAYEMRTSFRKWAQLVREALEVAKVRPPADDEAFRSTSK